MSPEDRKRRQQDVMRAFERLDCDNRERILRFAEHLAQHKLVSMAYWGDENPEPYCLLTGLN